MRVAIIGNSGSGKTTLAKRLSTLNASRLLELDIVYWESGKIAEQRAMKEIKSDIEAFISIDNNWVIEGCYSELIRGIMDQLDILIFMNPGVDKCIENSLKRPWEPEKYKSKEEQNSKLDYLVDWIKGYYTRNEGICLKADQALFDDFQGIKVEVVKIAS